MFYGEEGVDAGGVRKVKCPVRKIAVFGLWISDYGRITCDLIDIPCFNKYDWSLLKSGFVITP